MDNNTSLMDIFNKKPNKIYFQTIDKKLLEYDVVLAIKGYPSILNNLNIQTRTIQLPDWIDEKNLKDYFKYIELNYDNHMMSHNNNFLQYNFNFKKITQITNFFENEPLLYCIFKKNIFPNINLENSVSLLLDAYKYCSSDTVSNEGIKSLWYNLLLKTIDYISDNFLYYLEKEETKLSKINLKVMEEILEKFLFKFYSIDNYGLIDNIYTEKIIKKLYEIRDIKSNFNLIELINNEYIHLSSDDSVNELAQLQNPTFRLNITKEFKYYQQEYKILFNKIEITFVMFYKNSEDTINIDVKINLKNNCIISFMTICYFTFEYENSDHNYYEHKNQQMNIKSITNNLNHNKPINIYKMQSFKKMIAEFNSGLFKNLFVNINLKFCYINTFLINALCLNFSSFYNEKKINKLSKHVIQVIIMNKKIQIDHEDQIVIALINWLTEDSNIYEDINEIIENIKWHKVTISLIFEFIMKFPHLVDDSDIEKLLIDSVIQNLEENPLLSGTNIENLQTNIGNEHFNNINFTCNNNRINDTRSIVFMLRQLFECSKRLNFSRYLSDNLKFCKIKSKSSINIDRQSIQSDDENKSSLHFLLMDNTTRKSLNNRGEHIEQMKNDTKIPDLNDTNLSNNLTSRVKIINVEKKEKT